jgi:hypothetical protein
MFKELKKYGNIWVVGPQRSGTRIGARMIATDTRFYYVDEQAYSIDSLSKLFAYCRATPQRKVIQGPAITRWIHHLAAPADAVVFMMRDLDDIHASERRINWQYDKVEAIKYGLTEGSAEEKQRFWQSFQRHQIANAYVVEYESLSGHPLWMPKDQRGDFEWNQIN